MFVLLEPYAGKLARTVLREEGSREASDLLGGIGKVFMDSKMIYEQISEIAHTNSKEEANAYLKLKWVLLNIESNQYSEHGWSSSFVLGWPNKEDVKYPEKQDDAIPF